MKYTILITIFLSFVACNKNTSSKHQSLESDTEIQKKLKYSGLPIEANVSFLSDLIKTNNTTQLIYELNILNNYKVPFTLKKVEIYDLKEDGNLIASFDSNYIDEHFERPGSDDLDDLKVLSNNQFGILNLELVFKQGQPIPKKVYHKLHFEGQNKKGETVIIPIEVAVIKIPEITKVTLGLPFNKKGKWLYEAAESHQASRFLTEGKATYPQRFAIDWIFLGNNGCFAENDIKHNKNWKSYGIELISVADGTIVGIKDGIIENVPLSEDMAVRITRETIGGNYIIIDIGNNLYAVYGHLIPNSLKVKIGDKVKKGQLIGLLGNSGNSDCPHLHFHLETKSNAFFGGEGMPYLIKDFIDLRKYSGEEVKNFFKGNSVSMDSLRPTEKHNELPIGYGLIEIK
ncbi:M23 family metallopeptidase [Flavobacterium sp. K5-23]|uniref:M23 family metallopeptidase n=1 Tax=Flavobacterium sp. K5-23 TaxID=2746225 RepID=UPI00200C1ED2|nr:M23 family metallopeptidase [Flavobacterium sp. K5-23]UQD56733.1 M23 family metallopeptidase [Flavobacterium sp. K5-23]